MTHVFSACYASFVSGRTHFCLAKHSHCDALIYLPCINSEKKVLLFVNVVSDWKASSLCLQTYSSSHLTDIMNWVLHCFLVLSCFYSDLIAKRMLRIEQYEKYQGICCFPFSIMSFLCKYLQKLDLKNVSRQQLTWKLNCDDAGKNKDDGIFKFSLQTGFLDPGQKVRIAVLFCPCK